MELAQLNLKNILITTIDARGHGHSSAPSELATPAHWFRYSHDIRAIVQHVKSVYKNPNNEPIQYIGIGHSMGGGCMVLLQSEEKIFDFIIIYEPILSSDSAQDVQRLPSLARVDWALQRTSVFDSAEAIRSELTAIKPFKYWRQDVIEAYIKYGFKPEAEGSSRLTLRCNNQYEASIFQINAKPEINGVIPDNLSPVVALFGEKSSMTHFESGLPKFYLTGKSPIISQFVPGAGHLLPMDDPKVFANLLWKWLCFMARMSKL